MNNKTKKLTCADLKRKIEELEAQLVHVYHFADKEISKASHAHMMGGAVVITLQALGGKKITAPFAIRNGLSDDTIAALRRDIVHSWEDATVFKPAQPK
jgi:hypothetical protein